MTAVVEFRDVARTYPGPPEVRALRPTSFVIETGEHVAIVGPSGSGKSTLLNVMGLLDRPTEGSYVFDGFDVATLTESERTALRGRRIGFVFQSFQLLPHRSAVENVMLSMLYTGVPRRDREPLALNTLDRVGMSHRATTACSRLSGGERQRVAIARALATRPGVLLCDEPTGNLDSETAESVLSVLDELHRDGLTIVVITHDQQVAARSPRTIMVKDGRVTPGATAPATAVIP